MKSAKISIFLMVILMLLITIPTKANVPVSITLVKTNTTKIWPIQKTKDGRYKRKKGFMWGLFKSKNACSCPKH